MNNLRELGDLGVVIVASAVCAAPVAIKSLVDCDLVKTITVVAAGVLGGFAVTAADMGAYHIIQNMPLGDIGGPFVLTLFMTSIPLTFIAGSYGAAAYAYLKMA